jgi:hypothetical protein
MFTALRRRMSAAARNRALLRAARRANGNRLPGRPVDAVIAPAACGGFLMLVRYTHTHRVPLPTRFETYDKTPDALEFDAAAAWLAAHGLALAGDWRPGEYGHQTAPLTSAPLEVTE